MASSPVGLILEEGDQDTLIPPSNFSIVEDRIYQSSLPQPSNFAFLQSLNLGSIIYLCLEPYPQENLVFPQLQNIQPFQFGIEGKTVPISICIPRCLFQKGHYHGGAESLDSFDPLQTGKGCSIVHLLEYQRFAAAKSRITDLTS